MVRPGYKQSDVGIIPEDWDLRPIGDFVERLEAGVSVNSVEDDGRSSRLRILKTSCAYHGKFYPTEAKEIAPKDLNRVKLNPRAGSIIVSRMNTPDLVGECGYVENDHDELFLPDRLWLTKHRADRPHNAKWLAECLGYEQVNRRIKSGATGTSGSMKNLSKEAFLSSVVPAPPTEDEQRAIAEALSNIEGLIDDLEALIAKRRALKTATMQQLLTGKTRLPEFEQSNGMRRTDVGEIPEDWECATLEYLADMKSGAAITSASISAEGAFPCYGGNGLRGFTNRKTHSGEFPLIGRQGAHCGNIQFAEGDFFASEHAIVVSAKTNVVPRWLSYVLRTLDLNKLSESSAQPGLSVSKIRPVKYPFPPKPEEQRAIADVLFDLDLAISTDETHISKIKAMKQGMMQELLTGRTRLV